MKHQVLFSLKDKSKKKVSSAATLLGALRVKMFACAYSLCSNYLLVHCV